MRRQSKDNNNRYNGGRSWGRYDGNHERDGHRNDMSHDGNGHSREDDTSRSYGGRGDRDRDRDGYARHQDRDSSRGSSQSHYGRHQSYRDERQSYRDERDLDSSRYEAPSYQHQQDGSNRRESDLPIDVEQVKSERIIPDQTGSMSNVNLPAPVPMKVESNQAIASAWSNNEKPGPGAELPSAKRVKLEDEKEYLEKKYLKTIDKKTWATTPLMDKLKSQYPGDIQDFHIRNDMKEDIDSWMEKKIDAADKALESINEYIAAARKTYEDSDSDDGIETNMFDGAMIDGKIIHSEDPYSPSEMEEFVTALPYNILFDSGFMMMGVHENDENYCYCPCSKKMVRTHDYE